MKKTAYHLHDNPRGIVVRLVSVVMVAEFAIMLLINFLEPLLGKDIPDIVWDYADSILLSIILVPALFYLVLRPMKAQQLVCERQNTELNEVSARLREDESLLMEQHQQALERLKHLTEVEKLSSLGTMVGGVAHEINNPLMGILNYVEYAQDKATDAKSKEVLANALHEIHRIKRIVSNMLVFARPDNTRQENCSVQEVLSRTLTLLEGEFMKNAVIIQVELAEDLPPIKCDAGSLQQVLINLLLNARDAMAGQKEQLIRVVGQYAGEEVTLSVRDNGPGIPDEIQHKIFNPFFTTKPVGKGTGLGLSVSKHLVELAGGTINSYSEYGYGGCFRVTFKIFLNPPE